MHFFHRKPYRFFYPAGLISLVLLPVLGFLYLKHEGYFTEYYAIEVNAWNPEQFKNDSIFNVEPESIRSFKTILLNGEPIGDLQKLNQARSEIQQLLTKKDTINGIHLIYGPKAKYASMIAGINICLKEEKKVGILRLSYVSYKNNLWVFNQKPYKGEIWVCDVLQPEFGQAQYRTPVLFDELVKDLKKMRFTFKNAKPFWPIGILYLIMLSLTIQKVVRQLRNQPFNH